MSVLSKGMHPIHKDNYEQAYPLPLLRGTVSPLLLNDCLQLQHHTVRYPRGVITPTLNKCM